MDSRIRQLEEFEKCWRTDMGKFYTGERVMIRGKDLHIDFADTGWLKFLIFTVTGRDFSDNQVSLTGSLWVYTSYPDPRIWNNRVAALATSARSTCSLAIDAATAVSDAHIYGRQADMRAFSFLLRAKSQVDENKSLDDLIVSELKTRRNIGGFGRPMVKVDERIPHILRRAKRLGLDQGQYFAILNRVQGILRSKGYPFALNYGGVAAALGADIGYTLSEYKVLTTLTFSAGMFACYLDALDHKEGAFFPLRCNSIVYEGPPVRRWVV